jgi:DNA-binding NarL/FixJ family response regulator
MAKITVLLVDDHTLFRESLRSLLKDFDSIEVIGEAGDGVEAVTCPHKVYHLLS